MQVYLKRWLNFFTFAGIEIDERNWDRIWDTGTTLAYRNVDRSWVAGIENEVGETN